MQNPNELTFPDPDDAPQFPVHHMGGHTDSLAALQGKGGVGSWAKIGIAVAALAIALVAFQRLTAPPEPATAVLVTTPAKVEVSVNGGALAQHNSPVKLENLSPESAHSIEISAEGFKTQTVRFQVAEAEVKTLEAVTLEPLKVDTGFALDSKPTGATVLVDGVKVGVTPFRAVTLQPGKHTVRVENGFTHEPWEGAIEPSAGQVLEMPAVELTALPKWKVKKAEQAAKAQAKLQAKLQAKQQAQAKRAAAATAVN